MRSYEMTYVNKDKWGWEFTVFDGSWIRMLHIYGSFDAFKEEFQISFRKATRGLQLIGKDDVYKRKEC